MNRIADYVAKLPKKWVIPPLVVAAILVFLLAVSMPDNNLHVSFLDVGQGDAILIQKGSQQVLVDGGPSPQAVCLGLGEKMPFWDRTIELMILTHPSADHVTGLVEVLNRYRVKRVLYPDLDFDSGVYDEWLRLIDEPAIEYVAGVGYNQSAGVCVAPIFREIASKTLEYLGVTPDDPYGYSLGDSRYDPARADWEEESRKIAQLYRQWNVPSSKKVRKKKGR